MTAGIYFNVIRADDTAIRAAVGSVKMAAGTDLYAMSLAVIGFPAAIVFDRSRGRTRRFRDHGTPGFKCLLNHHARLAARDSTAVSQAIRSDVSFERHIVGFGGKRPDPGNIRDHDAVRRKGRKNEKQ